MPEIESFLFISIDVVDQKLPDSFIQGFDSESFGESAADSSEKYYFIEPEDDVIIFAISKRGIAVLFELPEADMALLKNEEVIWRRGVKDGRMYIRGGEIVFLPMVIENIGNGIAHNFCFGLSKSNEDPHFRTESVLKRGRPTKFVVFSKEKFEDIVGDYSFEVQYCDIVGNQYKQAFPLSIKTENNRKYESIDLEGKQYRIGKRTKKA